MKLVGTLSLIIFACLAMSTVSQQTEAQTFAADLVIPSRDIFKIDPVEIEKVRVTMTIVDGRVVYEK